MDASIIELARKLEPQGRVLRMQTLTGGISAQVTLLEIALPPASNKPLRKVVLRHFATHAAAELLHREFQRLQFLYTLRLPVPRPWALESVLLPEQNCPQTVLVLDYLEGDPEFRQPPGAKALTQMAQLLAQLHRVRQQDHLASRELFPLRLEQVVLELQQPGVGDESLNESHIRAALRAAWPQIQAQSTETVLLHGDFWLGNLLWQEEQLAGLIDWEAAAWGPPLAELANARLELQLLWGPESKHALTAAYAQATGRELSLLPFWDLWAALRPMGKLALWAAAWPELGRPELTLASMSAAHQAFSREALQHLAQLGI